LTSAWQLYFGIIFIGIVMFAPNGIAGLLMMHRPLVRAGTLGMMIPSYLLSVIPTLALACGVVLAIETVARYAQGAGADKTIALFGVPFDSTAPLTWVVAAVLTIGGFVIARLAWRAIAAAWDRATSVARDRGHLA
jgi:branched-chain amino acid transport system permease protein